MKTYHFSFIVLLVILSSCKDNIPKQKELAIESRISLMKQQIDSTKQETLKIESKTRVNSLKADQILGVWEVRSDHNMGIYEIEKHKDTYRGKIHYYNDGTNEYLGNNDTSDYFLSDLVYEDGIYHNGELFMPDGTNYKVRMRLKTNEELELKMNVGVEPYTEIWKRQNNN
ncbi:DUF2147 domain-containing protein [Winogradskyella sp.]|uniref:DUF2147 domain-containing protein n=1 Tax=Winogradskyella sp. TaxID=1883156 RepID=UPI002629C00D|nr:DUF2147 domain-containing protein [Winogradskyella sp.]